MQWTQPSLLDLLEPPRLDISVHWLAYTLMALPLPVIHCKCGYKNTDPNTFQTHLGAT